MSTLNREANARAARAAAAWDRKRQRFLRRQLLAARPPPLPATPRLPRWAGSSCWHADAGGCDRGRGGVKARERTEA